MYEGIENIADKKRYTDKINKPVFCSSLPAEGDRKVHLFLDTDLYTDKMKDMIARLERSNGSIEKKNERENKRSKDKGRLSDEELSRLVPKDVHDVLAAHPDMGTITIETIRTKLNAGQVYALYKQRQQIERVSRHMMIRSDSIHHTCMMTSLWRRGCFLIIFP